MGTEPKVSGIVLAGGMSRRLGRNKAMESVGGQPLISRVIGRLGSVTDQTVVVVNDMERASDLPLPDSANVAVDMYPGKGSLGGIFTGLSAVETDWGIVVACDMPFLNANLFKHMLTLIDRFDVVVPLIDNRPEPTHALYSKTCLQSIENRLQAGDLKIAHFFHDVRVRFVHEEEFGGLDPDRLSFFNVNTQSDMDRTLALVARGF